MSPKEIVARLAFGTCLLDGMAIEIHESVELVRSLSGIRNLVESPLEFQNGLYKWRVSSNSATCLIQEGDTWVVIFTDGNSSPLNQGSVLERENIIKVHEALDCFVEGMLQKFPDLEKKWAHILEASTYQACVF